MTKWKLFPGGKNEKLDSTRGCRSYPCPVRAGGSIRSEYKGPRRLICPSDLDRGVAIHVISRDTAIEDCGFIIPNGGWNSNNDGKQDGT
jgi:hypothetical protein